MDNIILKVSTAYLPPLDFFAALVKVGRFYVDTREMYRKQTFRNKGFIVTSQGPLALSLPCVKPYGKNTQVRKVSVLMSEPWAREHWRSLCTAYNKSPYFLYYRDEIEAFYAGMMRGNSLKDENGPDRMPSLVTINNFFIDFAIRKLKLKVDRLSEPDPKENQAGTEGLSGEVQSFDISPKEACRFEYEPYLQTFPCGMPAGHLSILDLMFNAGPESSYYLESARETV